jgi:hypothetical protein
MSSADDKTWDEARATVALAIAAQDLIISVASAMPVLWKEATRWVTLRGRSRGCRRSRSST